MRHGLSMEKTSIDNNANVTLDMLCLQDGGFRWLHSDIKQFLPSQNPPCKLQRTIGGNSRYQGIHNIWNFKPAWIFILTCVNILKP